MQLSRRAHITTSTTTSTISLTRRGHKTPSSLSATSKKCGGMITSVMKMMPMSSPPSGCSSLLLLVSIISLLCCYVTTSTSIGLTAEAATTCVTVTDSDLNTTLRLSDSQRGVIQILATFSSTTLNRNGIAGMLAAIKESARDNELPFHRINTSIMQYATSTPSATVAQSIKTNLISNTYKSDTFPFTAVLGLDFDIADIVAKSINGTTAANTPLVNPKTIDTAYLASSYPNLLHYKPSLESEILHLIRFAFLQLDCANSDLHVSSTLTQLADYVSVITAAFTTAGFPAPSVIYTPKIGSTNTTLKQAYVEAVLGAGLNRNVQCVFFLDYFRRDLHELLLADSRGEQFFHSTAIMYTSIGASTLPDLTLAQASNYDHVYFTSTSPNVEGTTSVATQFQAALSSFNAEHSESDHKLMNGGVVVNASAVNGYYPGDVAAATPAGMEHYISTRWLLQLLAASLPSPKTLFRTKMIEQQGSGSCDISTFNVSAAFPTPMSEPTTTDIIDAAYNNQIRVAEDYSVGPLEIQKCLITYATTTTSTDCFCNVGGKLLYASKYDKILLQAASYLEISDFGVASEVVSITPARQCSLTTADLSNAIPTTFAFMLDATTLSSADYAASATSSILAALATLFNELGTITTSTLHTTLVNTTGYNEYETQQGYAESINTTSPFLLIGSSSRLTYLSSTSSTTLLLANTSNASGYYTAPTATVSAAPVHTTLSLANGIDSYELEDDDLVPFAKWNSAHVSFSATFADHMQALISYYTDQTRKPGGTSFSSLQAIFETSAQAALFNSSATTFGVSASSIVVMDNATSVADFRGHIQDAVNNGGATPFIVIGLMNDLSLASELLYVINSTGVVLPKAGMRFGLVAPEEAPNALFEIISPNAELTTLNKLKNGGVTSDLFATYSKPVTASTIFTRVNALSLNDTSSSTTPDILFASHLGEWYVPRTKTIAIVSPIIFRRADIMKAAVDIFQSSTTSSTDGGIKTLYSAINVAGVSTSYGPFYNSECDPQVIALNRRDRTCQCAKGPRKFHVLSFLNMYDLKSSTRTSQFTYTQSGCGVTYRDALVAPPSSSIVASSGLSTAQIAGIAAGVASLFLLVALIVVGIYFCRRHMAVRYAPKDSSLPFAMAFTDIQSSTALWARAPEAMATSVDHHHAILRHCVKKYEGYEVKTIGDSFMVAFHDADSATRFALGVQAALYDFTKWAPEIDETYIELLLEQQNKAGAGVVDLGDVTNPIDKVVNVWLPVEPISGELDHDAYDAIWKGLRVRVGVHFGVGEIKRDKVSDRFDYYGTVVNTAARVEGVGHGGQVLLTDEAFHSLSADFDTKVSFEVLDLGPQPLRGLDAPVSLYQLTPMSVAARVYPPLRLDVENVPIEAETEDDDESDSDSSQQSNLTDASRKGGRVRADPWSAEAVAAALIVKELKVGGAYRTPSSSNQSLVTPFQPNTNDTSHSKSMPRSNNNNPSSPVPMSNTVSAPHTTSSPPMAAVKMEGSLSMLRDGEDDSTTDMPAFGNDDMDGVDVGNNILEAPTSATKSVANKEVMKGRQRPGDIEMTSYHDNDNNNTAAFSPSSSPPFLSGPETPQLHNDFKNKNGSSPSSAMKQRNFGSSDIPQSIGTQNNNNNNNNISNNANNNANKVASSKTKRLLSLYYFLVAALSTSTASYRNDVVSHISKKWHIKNKQLPSERLHARLAKRKNFSRRNSIHTNATTMSRATRRGAPVQPVTQKAKDDAYDHMYIMMKLCAKVEKTAASYQEKNAVDNTTSFKTLR